MSRENRGFISENNMDKPAGLDIPPIAEIERVILEFAKNNPAGFTYVDLDQKIHNELEGEDKSVPSQTIRDILNS